MFSVHFVVLQFLFSTHSTGKRRRRRRRRRRKKERKKERKKKQGKSREEEQEEKEKKRKRTDNKNKKNKKKKQSLQRNIFYIDVIITYILHMFWRRFITAEAITATRLE